MYNRLNILKIWVDNVNMNEALKKVDEFVKLGNRPHSIFAVNPEKCLNVPKHPNLLESFRTADLLIPDGIGVVLAAKILYGLKITRVTGVELMEEICKLAATKSYKIFLFGAHEQVNKIASELLKKKYPGLEIVGRAHGYISENDMLTLINQINKSDADILFIALGSPKQEEWYINYSKYLQNIKICQGIGGTLDSITGNYRRAPFVFQRLGLEWLYRSLANPRRVWRARSNLLFGGLVIILKIRQIFSK